MKIEEITNKELADKVVEFKVDISGLDSEDDIQAAVTKLDDDLKKDPDKLQEKLEFQVTESKKAYDARDKAKKDTRTLKTKLDSQEEELADLKKKLEGSPSVDEYKQLKKDMDAIQAEREEKELSKLDEVEKQKVRFQKKMDDFESKFDQTTNSFTQQMEEKDKELAASKKQVASLRTVRLGAEISKAAAKLNAYNPEQIEKLLVGDFVYDDKLDTYSFLERDGKGKIVDEKTIAERVKDFLDDPINDNLVRSGAKAGIGANDKGTKTDNKDTGVEDKARKGFTKMSQKRGEYDPKDPDVIRAAELKGLSVEDHIETLKIRDAKLNKIKGIKEDN